MEGKTGRTKGKENTCRTVGITKALADSGHSTARKGFFYFFALKFGYSIETKNPNASPIRKVFGLFVCGRDDRSRTCLNLLPKQAGNRYPTSRYSVFGVKSVGVQIKGARDPALRIRSARRLSPPRLSCSGSEPPGTPHIHFCPRRQSDLPYCRRKRRRTDASAG